MTTPTITRFRHIDADTDTIYVGEIEITEERGEFGETLTDATVLSCWAYGLAVEEVNVYEKGFPADLCRAIIQTAFEQRMTPPATPVELPSDWEEFEVLGVSYTYRIQSPAELPAVMNDIEKQANGLKRVTRIVPLYERKYIVQCDGSFDEMRRELSRVKIH